MTARGARELRDLDLVFNALAHQSRRTILTVLHTHGGAMTSGAIASWFDSSWPTTTRHLRVLEDAGLVQVQLNGRERIYRLATTRLHAVAGNWLTRFDNEQTSEDEAVMSHVVQAEEREQQASRANRVRSAESGGPAPR